MGLWPKMVSCLSATPGRVGSSRHGRCRFIAGSKPDPTVTNTKCDRSPPPALSRRIAVLVAITKSVPEQRML